MTKKCGFVAIIGRPNVGKSTLLNHIVGEKISITSHKRQTTRHQIYGIKTKDNSQTIYIDTPGIEQKTKLYINSYMTKAALSVINDVDVVVFMVDSNKLNQEDLFVIEKLADIKKLIVVINKIDRINKADLLPIIARLKDKVKSDLFLPICAKTGDNVDKLESMIVDFLPNSENFFYDETAKTDKNNTFRIAEFIREQVFLSFSDEIPYKTTVEVEKITRNDSNKLHIYALIWVESASQKGIVIGKKGQALKVVGIKAREQIEKFLQEQVCLKLYVKVKDNWSNDEKLLKEFGLSLE